MCIRDRFRAINATDSGITSEQLSEEEYQNYISGTVLVARSVTAEKIAAETITANEIASGAISTDKLQAESVTAAKIKTGTITTSHVESDFGHKLDISSNQSITSVVSSVSNAQSTADVAQGPRTRISSMRAAARTGARSAAS